MGDIKPLGLEDLGVSKSVVSSDDLDSPVTMWSLKWALNKVETGRNRNAGNSEIWAGALCGCSFKNGRSNGCILDVEDLEAIPCGIVLIDRVGGRARLGLRFDFSDSLSLSKGTLFSEVAASSSAGGRLGTGMR